MSPIFPPAAPADERHRQEADQLREEAGRLRQRINEMELLLQQKDEEIKQLHAELLAQKASFQAAEQKWAQQVADLQHVAQVGGFWGGGGWGAMDGPCFAVLC